MFFQLAVGQEAAAALLQQWRGEQKAGDFVSASLGTSSLLKLPF